MDTGRATHMKRSSSIRRTDVERKRIERGLSYRLSWEQHSYCVDNQFRLSSYFTDTFTKGICYGQLFKSESTNNFPTDTVTNVQTPLDVSDDVYLCYDLHSTAALLPIMNPYMIADSQVNGKFFPRIDILSKQANFVTDTVPLTVYDARKTYIASSSSTRTITWSGQQQPYNDVWTVNPTHSHVHWHARYILHVGG